MLGRPHTHQHMPTRSVFLGELSCAGDPSRYVEAVCHLHSSLLTCSADLAGPTPLPLVINTAGWIKVQYTCCSSKLSWLAFGATSVITHVRSAMLQ